MEGISILMSYLASILIKVFSLSGTDTLDLFFDTFNGRNYTGVTAGAVTDSGLFGQAYTLFMYCAFAIIFLGMLYQIFKAFFGPLVQAESPGRVVIKACFFAVLAANAQNIVALVFEIAQIPYDAISSGIPDVNGSYFWDKIGDNLAGSDFDIGSFIAGTVQPAMSMDFWSSVLSIVLFFMLIKNFMALALELAERYLMLGLLTIIAPLCIACGSLKATEEVFKNWLSWVINGCIVMIFTTFFLGVFIIGFSAKADVPYLLLWIAWFKTGQKIDEHMNALGLKTAKTGGFGMDVMGTMAAGLPAALSAVNKMAGTGIGLPLSNMMRARGNGGDPSKKTLPAILGMGDMRTGQGGTGITGWRNRALAKLDDKLTGKKDEKGKTIKGSGKGQDLLRKAEIQASRGFNTLKEAATFQGKSHENASGLTHAQLQKMASGEMPMPAVGTPEFQNVAKDLVAMKGGEEFANKLTENGFKFNNMQMDKKTGDLKFSAEDENGNKIQGTITEDPNKVNGEHQLVGDDGTERGFIGKTEENENAPMKPLFPEQEGNEDVNAANVIGANEEDLQQSGTINNGEQMSDANNVGIDGGAVNENGAQAEDFDKVGAADVNEQIAGDNVQSTPTKVTDSQGNTYELGEANEQGMMTGVTADGQEATFRQNEDGSITKAGNVNDAEIIDSNNIESSMSATDSNGRTFNLSNNGDGTFTGTSADGSTATFSQNEDGSLQKTSEQRSFDQSQGIQTGVHSEIIGSNQVHSSDGVPSTATDSRGVDYRLKDNGDGTFTGINAAGQTATFTQGADGSLNMDRSAHFATDKSGNQFEVNSNSLHDTVKDVNGTSQNIDTSRAMTRNADNTISAYNEAGQHVTLGAASGVTTCTDSKTNDSFVADYSKGFSASYNHDTGKMQVSAYDGNGDKHSIQGGSVNINGNSLDMSKGVSVNTDSNGDRTYQGTNTEGKQFSFRDSDIRNATVSGGTTKAITTKTADISNAAGQTANTMSFTSPTSGAGSIVQTTDGKFVQTTDGRRYDRYGNESATGGYMQTKGDNGVPSYVPVMQTASGQIPTYGFKDNQLGFTSGDGAGFKTMVGGKLQNPTAEDISKGTKTSYQSSSEGACTHYSMNGQTYKAWESDHGQNTKIVDSKGHESNATMSQRYIASNSDHNTKLALDMSRTKFTPEGHPIPDNNGNFYVSTGQTEIRGGKEVPVYTPISANDVYKGSNSKEHGNGTNPACYVKAHDKDNGTPIYFEHRDAAPQVAGPNYYNGVRVDMDLNRGSATPILDKANQPTGQLLYKNQGEEYVLHPQGTDVSKCNGSWITMPNGKSYFAEPNPANYMTTEISKLGLNPAQEKYTNVTVDTTSPQAQSFCKQFGISGDVKSIRLTKNGTNISIAYEQGGQNYCVTSNRINGIKQEDIISKNTGNVTAYKSVVKKGQTAQNPIVKAISKSKARFTFQRNYRGNKK